MTKLCFVGLYAYSLFNRQSRHRFGGAELRAYLFSTGLARTGQFEVSFVVMDHGQPALEWIDGVTVYAHPGYGSVLQTNPLKLLTRNAASARRVLTGDPRRLLRWAAVRLLWPLRHRRVRSATPSLRIGGYVIRGEKLAIYDTINADVYCVLGVSNLAGEVAAYCRSRNKPFALFLASDYNLNDRYQESAEGVNTHGDFLHVCHYSLASPDLVVVQTELQRQLLESRFCRAGIVIRNPVAIATTNGMAQASRLRTIALWVGRADRAVKMPLLLLRLARACPDVSFVMIMNPGDFEVEHEVRRHKPDNVLLYDLMPYDVLDALFDQTFVLVNTSRHEGFPNTFLQAGTHGVPILSYRVDPDGYIERQRCGIVAKGDFSALVSGLREIKADQEGAGILGRNNSAYVEQNHKLEERVQELSEALRSLQGRRSTLLGDNVHSLTGNCS